MPGEMLLNSLANSGSDHNSAFRHRPKNPTVLLGGIGNLTRCYPNSPTIVPTKFQNPFTLTFVEGTKYLLRVINTAYDSTFLFTIDNHNLTVVSADFVPIEPYTTDSIIVGIGQRYNVIVEASPSDSTVTDFWIRTYVVTECHGGPPPGADYMKTGIIRYDNTSTADPQTSPWDGIDFTTCRDETNIVPVFKWQPTTQSNPNEPPRAVTNSDGTHPYPRAFFSFETPSEVGSHKFLPLRIDWQNVTFLNLNNTGGWPDPWIILPEDYNETSWVRKFLISDPA
jgi:multicopper oxidase